MSGRTPATKLRAVARSPLTERSRCGIHGLSTSSGRCPECDLDAMTAWVAARRAFRSSTEGSSEHFASVAESERLEAWIEAAADAGDPVAEKFLATMLDVDEAIRLEVHGA